jgi:predicted GTPase
MAVEQKNGLWYDTNLKRFYSHEPIEAGDTVVYIGNRSSTFEKGQTLVVGEIGNPNSESVYIGGAYTVKYTQNFYERGYGVKRSMKNWKKVEKSAVLALETNRPVIVQEISETLVDGKATIVNVGDPIDLESLSAARVFTANEISNSIREKNVYRQFRIYQEHSIARAKKPEIEFA